MTDELKLCPFCGKKATVDMISSPTWDKFVPHCTNRKCVAFYIGYCDEGLYETESKAIEAWNNRTDVSEDIKQTKQKENLKFNDGDYARIVANHTAHHFEIGTIVKLEKCDRYYKVYAERDWWWVSDDELAAIDAETELSTIIDQSER